MVWICVHEFMAGAQLPAAAIAALCRHLWGDGLAYDAAADKFVIRMIRIPRLHTQHRETAQFEIRLRCIADRF